MSSIAIDKLSSSEVQQLSLSYAAFLISDAGAKVDAKTLQSVLDAAGIKAEKIWVDLFAKSLASKPVESFFGGVSSGSASAGSTSAPEKVVEKKEDKKAGKKEKEAPPPPPAEEEEGMDMGGLFD